MAYLVAFALYPLAQLVYMSVSNVTSDDILRSWPPAGVQNFRTTISDPAFATAFTNTLEIVGVLLLVGIVGGTTAALAFRANTVFVKVTLALMLFAWSLPAVVTGNLWRFLLARDGVVNAIAARLHLVAQPIPWLVDSRLAILAIATASAWTVLPFSVLVVRAALLDVPQDQLDAAAIDGAGPLGRFGNVMLPHLRPTLYVLGVLLVVNGFRTFDLVYVMTNGGPGTATATLPFLAYRQAFQDFQFGVGAGTAVFSLAVVLVVAVFYAAGGRERRPA